MRFSNASCSWALAWSIFVSACISFPLGTMQRQTRLTSHIQAFQYEHESTNERVGGHALSRSRVLLLLGASLAVPTLLPQHAVAADADFRVTACAKPETGNANCVSTASVKQVDLYMAPWSWPEGTSAEEVVGRLKGVITSDGTLELLEKSDRYLKVRAARNFCYDEIEFLVNPNDRVVTFRSQQVEGPDNVSDFGANRKRLDELRKRTGVLTVMGEEFSSADAGPREGTIGQLKAFWGLQSGGGFESILLDEE